MKIVLNALVLVSLSLSCNFALAAAPTDSVATPAAATPGNDSDVKGTIAAPTAEQKENVANPVKKAQAKKAKKKTKKETRARHPHTPNN